METLIGKTRSGKPIRISWGKRPEDFDDHVTIWSFGNIADDLDVLCATQAWISLTHKKNQHFFDPKWVHLEGELMNHRRHLAALGDEDIRERLNIHTSLAEATFGRALLGKEFLPR